MKIFEGLELEGKLQGVKTLFINGDQSLEDILSVYTDHEQIYFGANFLSEINYKTVQEIHDRIAKYITIETVNLIPEEILMLSKIQVMLPVCTPYKEIKALNHYAEHINRYQKYIEKIQIKIDSGIFIHCFDLKDCIQNDYKFYPNDRILL